MSLKLNRQVAALMGWEQIDQDTWRDDDEVAHVVGFMVRANFNPAGCENSAGLVLDRISALGWMATVGTIPNQVKHCLIHRPDDTVLGEADTRPLAICRAFVEAMAG